MIRKSFQLIRTNPLLTTNIKLVVNSVDSLYLESFNSSQDLNNNKYKHYHINKNDYLEDRIPDFYDKLPPDIAFYIRYDNDASSTYNDYSYQFDTIYFAGADKVEDTWYSEEFEYFAPLYIRNTSLPSNFIILRCDDSSNYNLDTDNNFQLSTLNKNNFFSEIIDKWKCVELFDLTTSSNLGKFLDKNYVKNPRFPSAPFYFDVRRTEFSKWIGMDYDSGIYTEKDFYLEDTLSTEQLHFKMEKLITDGYKNNKLIFPNILNLKFLFDDTPATPDGLKKYSMNRYYGFYTESMDFVGSITSYITPEIKSGLWLINNIIVSGNTGVTWDACDLNYHWTYPSINPFVEEWSNEKEYYIFLDNTDNFYRKKTISGLYPVKKTTQNGVEVFKIISDDIMDEIWNPSGYTYRSLTYHPDRVNLKTCNIEYKKVNTLTGTTNNSFFIDIISGSTNSGIDWYYDISGNTKYMFGDLYLINIDGIYHVLKNGSEIIYSDFNDTRNEVKILSGNTLLGYKYYIQTDWGINSNINKLEYWINGKNSNFYRTLPTQTKNKTPLQFNIYRIKFSDIKDFDFDRINSNFSNFDYEQTHYVETQEEKLYAVDYTDQSFPQGYKTEKYGTSSQFKISNVSSEYIADDELFEINQNQTNINMNQSIYMAGNKVQRQLSELWRKNQTICKWGFMGSISHSDYDYKLNNSLSVGGVFNRTIDPFITYPDVMSKNLDYFYRIGNFYNVDTGNTVYYKFQSTNIEGDYIFAQKGNGFDIETYFNTNFDYFTYFFKNKMNSLNSGNLSTINYDKYSVFNFGNIYNSSVTLFKGLKVNIKSIVNIDVIDDSNGNSKINKILYDTNKNYNDYKFTIILNEVYNGISSGIINNNNINIDLSKNGINIILNEKWKNILIIINFLINSDKKLNDLSVYDERNGLYYGLNKNKNSILNYKSNILTAYNFINSINIPEHSLTMDPYKSPFSYINYYYITEFNNETYIGITDNINLSKSTMTEIPNWGKSFSPFIIHIDYPDSILLNSQKKYKIDPYKGLETKSFLGYSTKDQLARIVIPLQDDRPQIMAMSNLSSNLIPTKNEIFRFSGPYEPIFKDINVFRGGIFYYTDFNMEIIPMSGITIQPANSTYCSSLILPTNSRSVSPPITQYQPLWENINSMCKENTTSSNTGWITENSVLQKYTQVNVSSYTRNIDTNSLFIGGFDFSSIPSNSIITGVTIYVTKRNINYSPLKYTCFDKNVQITKNRFEISQTSNNYALEDEWVNSDDFLNFKYPPNISSPYEPLWGFSNISVSDLNSNEFGVLFSCTVTNDDTMWVIIPQIKCVTMEIEYYYDDKKFFWDESIFMDNNIKFDTSISNFGEINDFIFSKVNENKSILQINQEKDISMYPIVDEYGYTYNKRFIFKSPWDREFFYRTNSDIISGEIVSTNSILTTINPTVITQAITFITQNSAISGGNVTSDGGAEVTERGVCWSTSNNPTVPDDSHTTNGTGTGIFVSNLTGLLSGTTYYVRAYATNYICTSYGNTLSFDTDGLPIISTYSATIISTSGFTSGGHIIKDGGKSIIQKGVCYSLLPNPNIFNFKITGSSSSDFFTCYIAPLTQNKTYYYKAYATNSIGTGYGNELNDKTLAFTVPKLTTTPVTNLTQTNVTTGGINISNGGDPIVVKGILVKDYCIDEVGNTILMPFGSQICENHIHTTWNLFNSSGLLIFPNVAKSGLPDPGGNPCYYSMTKTISYGSGSNNYSMDLSGFTSGYECSVTAYATNGVGTGYGEEIFFTTSQTTAPSIMTKIVTYITQTGATSGGYNIYENGSPVTEKGLCWNTISNPTISNPRNINGTGTSPFNGYLTSLSPGTTYYVRAYATNNIGTSYGNEYSFQTLNSKPTVATKPITNIEYNSAIGGGIIVLTGGLSITSMGVCWSNTNNPPTTADSYTTETFSTNFISSLSSLTIGTLYYVRAYAANNMGTSYGSVVSFTTKTNPTVTTSAVVVSGQDITSGGFVTPNAGGYDVTGRGVCWSTSHNPTISNSHTSDGTGWGSFTSVINVGGNYNTTYYVRAYAVSLGGVLCGYGSERSFVSPPHP